MVQSLSALDKLAVVFKSANATHPLVTKTTDNTTMHNEQ